MPIIYDFFDGPKDCVYLPNQQALMQYQLAASLEAGEYERMMGERFRKFGQLLFRPVCLSCNACQPLRVLVGSFSPDRSMKRCLKANQDLGISIGPAQNSSDRITLFNRYHKSHAEMKYWTTADIAAQEYSFQFLESPLQIEEIALYQKDCIIGLMLIEELSNGISLIYHYYDSMLKQRSLGTFLILTAIELARQRKKEFAYLGYFVSGCGSMEYKARFQPNQILKNGMWQG